MKTNNNIPAYRFQGYTDAWELRKLGELTSYRNGKGYEDNQSDFGKYELINLNSISIEGGLKPSGKFINSASETLNKNDLVMVLSDVGHGDLLGRVAIIPEDDRFVLNQRVALLRNNDYADCKYLFSYINANQHYFKLQGAGSSQLNISKKAVENFVVHIPSPKEQSAIGTFFSTLDRHITLHQHKLDMLKEQKKTYLKLLFPAKGQTKPALRFQGFEDDWKEVKLGELCDIRTGKLDANAMVENGEYDFYTSGIKKYRIDVAEFEGPAITIAGNGATVGYMHLADGKFNAYQRTYVLTNFKVDRSYIFSEIAKKLPIKIQQEARTGNIPYIVLSMLTELLISLPTLPEQEAIGTFFQTLEQEIAQVEDKLASLKEMKKTLLRKLFV
ncbi:MULTISPECIES: restriction endonuclease subunit S [Streptococcus]|uniref:restriction endonuclease subunit S n=1 Tax=Streptococcus TaxID=1301 RepID=UPI000CF47A1E|nr:restriction endonuclease subunit S [Streptococcus suis]MBM7321099.1 restriction endonuclease subunit S [Streptococcus suis]MCK4024078.1 restriction endonuclease subunit S [Streptococcus suis]MCL4897782.1 restriction endonuclease subunit S [Streptococcus suis]NQL17747.1 restriction endonuclease subunit S [Streptococcus suis]HEL2008057.1 restriction endonuclease subunit S [Streptococcus suis]